MKIYIMRGVPGSGKTRWCRSYMNALPVDKRVCYFSADRYMIDASGKYDFKPERLSEVHNKCFMDYVSMFSVTDQLFAAFVDNTNLKVFEIAPYYRLAEVFGHEVEIIQFLTDPFEAAARNSHGVLPAKVLEMHKGMEAIPPWWKVTYVK